MITSTVSKRGQTTLPRQVRDALRISSGRRLIYDIKGDRVIVRAHPGIMASFGSLKSYAPKTNTPWEEIRNAAHEEWADHAAKEGLSE